MEQDYRLAEGEYRFACLVWANEPLGSGQLVALANEALGWKKSTTYTVLKSYVSAVYYTMQTAP